jgi:hypothetical protein
MTKKYLKVKSFEKAPLAPATSRPVRSLRPMRSMSVSKGVRPSAPISAVTLSEGPK